MTATQHHRPAERICFGPFEFRPIERQLLRQGVPVALGSRAMDVLAALTERPGEIVNKQDLLARVWPDATVVDAALRVHLGALRRALAEGGGGEELIRTVPGRGYAFVGELESLNCVAEEGASRATVRPLPARPAKVVGRDGVVDDLTRELELRRFVSVVGPGGIGKTTVALIVAHQWQGEGRGETVFVDLSELGTDSGEGIPEVLCDRLGLAPQEVGAAEAAIAYLRSRQALIVLDTCEGVVEAAARLAETLVTAAPGVRVLTTSREALRAAGEVVYHIEPLASPPADRQLTAQEALTFPAVQLFMQRAVAHHAGFELSDAHAPLVAAICRELDGVPLAIELAAGRVEAFGVQQVADQLATEFALAWPGRRTAAPRLQTLNATLNWSYELLSALERTVFRRISALAGAFPLEVAVAVAADGLAAADVVQALGSLVSKSLLNTVTDGPPRLRMLDTTRSYALAKLTESGDEPATRLRQTQHYLARLTEADAEDDDPSVVAEQTANVSAALTWAFGATGEPSIGIQLTTAAAGLWVRHGLLAECRRWAHVVQAQLDRYPNPPHIRTRLILANALMLTDGIGEARRRDWETAYASALKQGRMDERLSGLVALWADQHRRGRLAAAERLIDEADFLEAPDASPAHRLTAVWLRGITDHRAGRHARACEHLSRLLSEYSEASGREFLRLVGYDLEVAGATILGMSEFLRGNLQASIAASERAIAKARTLNSPATLSGALRWRAMAIYFSDDDATEVDQLTRELLPTTEMVDMHGPDGAALALRGLWLARNGDCAQGAEMVRQGLNACLRTDYMAVRSITNAELALQLLRHGAGEAIDAFTAPLESDEEEDGWSTPEVLRIRGEIAELRGDLFLAEVRYGEAMTLAERQEALTWRLRAAISLANLWLSQGRAEDAAALLAPIRGQFRSGPDWALLRRADDCLSASRTGQTASRAAR